MHGRLMLESRMADLISDGTAQDSAQLMADAMHCREHYRHARCYCKTVQQPCCTPAQSSSQPVKEPLRFTRLTTPVRRAQNPNDTEDRVKLTAVQPAQGPLKPGCRAGSCTSASSLSSLLLSPDSSSSASAAASAGVAVPSCSLPLSSPVPRHSLHHFLKRTNAQRCANMHMRSGRIRQHA